MAPSKKDTGCVGFFHGGIILTGRCVLGFSDQKEPDDIYDQLVVHYGDKLRFKYVSCENPEAVFKKFKTEMINGLVSDNIYTGSISASERALKDVSKIETAHNWPKKVKKESENDTDTADTKPKRARSASSKVKGKDSGDEPAEKSKTVKGKKSNSDDDEPSEKSKIVKGKKSNDDDEPAEKSKTVKGKKSNSDDDEPAEKSKTTKGKKHEEAVEDTPNKKKKEEAAKEKPKETPKKSK
jgi:hypothetical protein